MKKEKAILTIFLAVFLCLSVSAVYAQNDQYETHAQINYVDLNGQGSYLIIEPGGLIEVEVFYEFVYPYPLPEKIVEIVVGFEDIPGICLIDGLLDDITGLTGIFDHRTGFGMIAPTEPGIYHIMRVRTEGYTCLEARALYRDYPSTRKIIGTIEVIGDEEENEKWDCIYEEFVEFIPLLDRIERNYSISFHQRQNELRMEIETPGAHTVKDGSLSISVAEDVYVNYATGEIYECAVGEEFRDMPSMPSNRIPNALFGVVMSIVPCAGMFSSAVNLGDVIYEETAKEFEVDYEVDADRILDCYYPHEIFTRSRYQNERDIVVVPWDVVYLIGGAHAIRVDCPHMEFPSKGTHTVVFCLVAEVYGVKVRHYIALPIEIGKQKIEW